MAATRRVRTATAAVALPALMLAVAARAEARPTPPQPARKPAVHLATLTWPPYTKAELPEGGAATAVVQAAFAAVGRRIEVGYFPWNRAIHYAGDNISPYVGYFPGYHCRHDPDRNFLRSQTIAKRPLGLAKRVNVPYDFETLRDLEGFRIGTVVGYANTKSLDRKIAAQEIWDIRAHSDRQNLLKLVNHKLNYAVIDPNVMKYLALNDPKIRQHRDDLVLDDTRLGTMPLVLCFQDSARGRALRRSFNRGLSRIHAQRLLESRVIRAMPGAPKLPE